MASECQMPDKGRAQGPTPTAHAPRPTSHDGELAQRMAKTTLTLTLTSWLPGWIGTLADFALSIAA